MSKFHSTVSRRTFMKGLGLGVAGLGATAAATIPAFHDLDELAAAPKGNVQKQPWWVKRREFKNLTTDIDWNIFKSYDKRTHNLNAPARDGSVITTEETARLREIEGKTRTQWMLEKKPGYTLRDYQLYRSGRGNRMRGQFLTPRNINPPEYYGVPRWEGTPEENSRTIRAAARLWGAAEVGFIELDEQTRRLFWHHDGKKFIKFEDVDEPYEDSTKKVIPNKARYVITILTQMSQEGWRLGAPSSLGEGFVFDAYARAGKLNVFIQEYLHGIGYLGISGSPGEILGFGAMSGLVELGRMGLMLSPMYGSMIRKTDIIVTDMPLAPTKPIDAGMNRFCYACKKCAELCPSDSIPHDTEPSYEVSGPWSNPGYRHWYLNRSTCYHHGWLAYLSDCGICIANCTFAKQDQALIHDVVKATVATTSIFNGFLRTMDDIMGYGKPFYSARGEFNPECEEWWDRDMPPYSLYPRPEYR